MEVCTSWSTTLFYQMSLFPPSNVIRWLGVPLKRENIEFPTSDGSLLEEVAEFCHRLVKDRDDSFSEMDRQNLYERWLTSGQPIVMAIKDDDSNVLGASIILPLKEVAYEQYCSGHLDALEIRKEHICKVGDPDTHRFLLIDILAVDDEAVKKHVTAGNNTFRELWIRALLFHIARFYNGLSIPEPVILCSTVHPDVVRTLSPFDAKADATEKSGIPIYRVFLKHALSPPPLPTMSKFYRAFFSNLVAYNRPTS